MRIALIRNWWALVLRGSLGVLLGVFTFAWPEVTLAGLVVLFGVYALIDGIFSLAGALRAVQSHERWGALVIEGLAGIAAAVVAFGWPAITVFAFIYVLGAWALITGVFEIAAAIRLRRHIAGEWLLAVAGAASMIFGFVLMAAPQVGAIVLAFWFGMYAFVFGVLMIALGLRLRTLRNDPHSGPAITAHAH